MCFFSSFYILFDETQLAMTLNASRFSAWERTAIAAATQRDSHNFRMIDSFVIDSNALSFFVHFEISIKNCEFSRRKKNSKNQQEKN